MNVQPGYNPEKRRITLSVETYLMMRYFNNFSGMVTENPGVPKDTEVEWFNLGIHNVMCIEVSCSDPINFAIVSAKIQFEQVDSF